MSLLAQVLVFLGATVVVVPLFKRLGLGSVLGYLVAGMAIGPWGARLVTDVERTLHVAELGVVLLLFLIGLELQPSRLWAMRRTVFGLGGLQVALTALAVALAARVLGLAWSGAAVAGVGLAMSSTAFALQLLAEKNQLTQAHGRVAFGILLFQDLSVIPALAALPFLSSAPAGGAAPGWLTALKVVAVLAGVMLAGRYLLKPLFRAVAAARSQELFTATALLLVLGTAALVSAVGLSMALGAFLAGMLLAESEYRHELEADIEPFKGLLLGLFFIAVGMAVNLGLVAARPLAVVGLALGLVGLKLAVLWGVGRWGAGLSSREALSLGVVISQGGEFAFVLFGLAASLGVLARETAGLLVVGVSVSMGLTPLLFLVLERWVLPRLGARGGRPYDAPPPESTPVLIAGFGRVGQVVGRVLRAKGIPFTALDASSEHIDFIRRFGNKVFFGDASRLDLLRAARAEEARVFVLAIDELEASMRCARTVKEHFPHLTLVARARNRQHAYELMNLGVEHIFRETWDASLALTHDVLEALGLPYAEARQTLERFRQHDEELLRRTFQHAGDPAKLIELSAQARAELQSLFEKDAAERAASGG